MNTAIYNAFAPLVTTFANGYSPALPVSCPGLNFDPPSEGRWLELQWIRAGLEEYGIGNRGPASVNGSFRVMVNARPGHSVTTATDIADALVLHIEKGTQIGPARIHQTPFVTGPITDDNVVMHMVTFRYRAVRFTGVFSDEFSYEFA